MFLASGVLALPPTVLDTELPTRDPARFEVWGTPLSTAAVYAPGGDRGRAPGSLDDLKTLWAVCCPGHGAFAVDVDYDDDDVAGFAVADQSPAIAAGQPFRGGPSASRCRQGSRIGSNLRSPMIDDAASEQADRHDAQRGDDDHRQQQHDSLTTITALWAHGSPPHQRMTTGQLCRCRATARGAREPYSSSLAMISATEATY